MENIKKKLICLILVAFASLCPIEGYSVYGKHHYKFNYLYDYYQWLVATGAVVLMGVTSDYYYQSKFFGKANNSNSSSFSHNEWEKIENGTAGFSLIVDDKNQVISKKAHIQLVVNYSPTLCEQSAPESGDQESMGEWLTNCYLKGKKNYITVEHASEALNRNAGSEQADELTMENRENFCSVRNKENCFIKRLGFLLKSINANEKLYILFDKGDDDVIRLRFAIVDKNSESGVVRSSPLLAMKRDWKENSIIWESFLAENGLPVFDEERQEWPCSFLTKENHDQSSEGQHKNCFALFKEQQFQKGNSWYGWFRDNKRAEKPEPGKHVISVFNEMGNISEAIKKYRADNNNTEYDFDKGDDQLVAEVDDGAVHTYILPLERVEITESKYVQLFGIGGLNCYHLPGLTHVRCALENPDWHYRYYSRQAALEYRDQKMKRKQALEQGLEHYDSQWEQVFINKKRQAETKEEENGTGQGVSAILSWLVSPYTGAVKLNQSMQSFRDAQKAYVFDPLKYVVKTGVELPVHAGLWAAKNMIAPAITWTISSPYYAYQGLQWTDQSIQPFRDWQKSSIHDPVKNVIKSTVEWPANAVWSTIKNVFQQEREDADQPLNNESSNTEDDQSFASKPDSNDFENSRMPEDQEDKSDDDDDDWATVETVDENNE